MATEANESKARTAGRGGIAVLGAKAFFIVSGLTQNTLLPRVIGLAGYGALSLVLAIVSILNNVVVASSTQGVSRAVARAGARDEEALRATLRVHAWIAVIAAIAFAAATPFIARFEHAPDIALPLMIVSGVVLMYGLYAPLVGALNGRAQFTRQASLDVTFATLRTIGVLGLGALFEKRGGSGVVGSTLGFVAAAVCIFPLALRWTGIGRAASRGGASSATDAVVPRAAVYLGALWPLALAQLFTNTVMQADIALLGRFLSQGATESGLTVAAAQNTSHEWVGVYRSAQLFAFLPYQLLVSVSQVLFPMVARAKAERDDAAVRMYVERGARLGAIACGLMVAVVAAIPGSLIAVLYSAEVAARGESTLRILALGQGAFAMLGIATTVLASLGRERTSAVITFVALGTMIAACWAIVPTRAFGQAQLVATAMATSGALACALVAGATQVKRAAGGFIPLKTALRVGAALAIAAAGGTLLPRFGRPMTIVAAAAIGVLYILFLVITGELGKSDLAMIRGLRGGAKA